MKEKYILSIYQAYPSEMSVISEHEVINIKLPLINYAFGIDKKKLVLSKKTEF